MSLYSVAESMLGTEGGISLGYQSDPSYNGGSANIMRIPNLMTLNRGYPKPVTAGANHKAGDLVDLSQTGPISAPSFTTITNGQGKFFTVAADTASGSPCPLVAIGIDATIASTTTTTTAGQACELSGPVSAPSAASLASSVPGFQWVAGGAYAANTPQALFFYRAVPKGARLVIAKAASDILAGEACNSYQSGSDLLASTADPAISLTNGLLTACDDVPSGTNGLFAGVPKYTNPGTN